MPEIFTSYGVVPVVLEGLVSNFVLSAPMVAIGERPLAMSLPLGSKFLARDTVYAGTTGVHPINRDQRIWFTPINNRSDSLATAGVGGVSAANRLGVYDPTTRVFTQATISGQFCNARSGGAAVQGASMICFIQIGTISAVVGATPLTIGQEIMSDATGLWIPYVNNGVNIPLGISPNIAAAASTLLAVQYDW